MIHCAECVKRRRVDVLERQGVTVVLKHFLEQVKRSTIESQL